MSFQSPTFSGSSVSWFPSSARSSSATILVHLSDRGPLKKLSLRLSFRSTLSSSIMEKTWSLPKSWFRLRSSSVSFRSSGTVRSSSGTKPKLLRLRSSVSLPWTTARRILKKTHSRRMASARSLRTAASPRRGHMQRSRSRMIVRVVTTSGPTGPLPLPLPFFPLPLAMVAPGRRPRRV